MPKELPAFTIQWHLTERCNLKCIHCYQDERFSKKELTFNQSEKIIEAILNALKIWKRKGRINFTGGEPLIKKKLLLQLIKCIKGKDPNIPIGILTNGTLLTTSVVKKLKEEGVSFVQVSLDGATEKVHDSIRGIRSFRKAVEGIRKLVKAKFTTAIMFTLHKRNMHEIPELINLALNLGVTRLGVERIVPIGYGKNLKNEMLTPEELHQVFLYLAKRRRELRKKKQKLDIWTYRPLWYLLRKEVKDFGIGGGCSAGLNGLTIMPNGDVMPCRRLNLVIGNILKDNLFEIWYSSPLLWDLRERKKIAGCGSCPNLPNCGGCRAVAYGATGNYLAKDPQCWKK